MSRRGLSLLLCAWLSACASEGADPVESQSSAIIYGADDRVEVFEHPDARLRDLASSSVVGIIPRKRFVRNPDGEFVIATLPLRQAFEVCADQRFVAQPTAADCSGVLIDDDLVLTAGHCVADDARCEDLAFVFDYFYRAPDELEPMGWGDIYGCRRLVRRVVSSERESPRIDYAVVQLDRTPAGRTPATARMTPLVDREALATIGCASGLPAKIESGSRVLDPRARGIDYFLLDSDTFAGSSGSGVFDASGLLVGILVRGGVDYELRPGAGCMVPKVISLSGDAGSRRHLGEEATYVARAIDGICGTGWPSQRLCGVAPRCGDGFCTADETRTRCPADCECRGAECVAPERAEAGEPGAVAKSAGGGEDGCAIAGDSRGDGAGLLAWLGGVVLMVRRRRG